jgi:hypothetical protein
MNFEQYNHNSAHDEIRMFLNNGGQGLNFDTEMNEVVKESFKSTRKFVWVGAWAFFFYFCVGFTFITGIIPVLEEDPDEYEAKRQAYYN